MYVFNFKLYCYNHRENIEEQNRGNLVGLLSRCLCCCRVKYIAVKDRLIYFYSNSVQHYE